MRFGAGLLLLLAGCDRAPPPPLSDGAKLERAAVAAGLVQDPARASVLGVWARDTDRLCIAPARDRLRVGVVVDYGEGQACSGSGTAQRDGGTLHLRFGACRFDAAFDGERISFPAEMPGECAALCTGRATLAAVAVERLSGSVSEAAMLRGSNGRSLCAD